MMARQISLRPVDIAVALRLVEAPDSTFDSLHHDLCISTSTAHEAVKRLSFAGLMHPHQRRVNRTALLEFLEHGIRYAFPAVVGERRVRGVPTAHSSPGLASEIVSDDAIVWPDPDGSAIGESIEPLYGQAVELPKRCRSVYEMLALIDALRVGRARERHLAIQQLRTRLAYGREAVGG